MVKDPVCGMRVADDAPLSSDWKGTTYRFCSALCQRLFTADPVRYEGSAASAEAARRSARVAYFSMEIAVDPGLPTYCGGLGILAGDTLRACADMGVPSIGITLLYREGYFIQRLKEGGHQVEEAARWDPAAHLRRLPVVVSVRIGTRDVAIQPWEYCIRGLGGEVPVLFLDADVEDNRPEDRAWTRRLYGGDERVRLAQEAILGIGGVRVLRALGQAGIRRYHMNEGHAALLALELLRETERGSPGTWDFSRLRESCVFTTHTPVPAGHDRFPYPLVREILGDVDLEPLRMLGGEEELNMSLLGLNASGFVNGVAKRHGEVSRDMFPDHVIRAITNGIHPVTWAAPPIAALFDRHVPGWKEDAFNLRASFRIPLGELREAHAAAKKTLLERIAAATGAHLDPQALTIAFARRMTPYKRPDLLFRDMERLRAIARDKGPFQLVFAGKAHPGDGAGKRLIEDIVRASRELSGPVPVVFLPDYGMETARLLVAGADVWLNTPRKPMEASGTSGMKAALNGVPSLSILDGWWLEGHIEDVTGWSIGTREPHEEDEAAEAAELYAKLADRILPLFHGEPEAWADLMRRTIAINGSYFNTQRMLQQYVSGAYAALATP